MGSLHASRLAFGPDGRTLFVTDGTRIRTVAPDGAVATLAGAAEAGEADGDRETARFRFAGAMAFDATGGLLVTDANRIRRVTREGAVTTLRGPADPETGERPPLVFDRPTGVAVGPKGVVHVLDRDGLRVSRVDGKGRVETLVELPRK
jgi:glucose/arabinose dehydrogenase